MHCRLPFALCFLLSALLFPALTTATVINVPEAQTTISGALAVANAGDIVSVKEGTQSYSETIDIPSGVRVEPRDASNHPVIDAGGASYAVTFQGAADTRTAIVGMTIQNFSADGVIIIGSSSGGQIAKIENCVITNGLIGVCLVAAEAIVTGNTITGPSTAGISLDQSLYTSTANHSKIQNNLLVKSAASGSGIVIAAYSWDPEVSGNTVVGWNYGIDLNSMATSSVVARNLVVGAAVKGIDCGNLGVSLANNDAWNNGSSSSDNYGSCGSDPLSSNISADPLFCASREGLVGEYTLRIDSPAVNNSWGVQIGAKGAECAWGSLARTSVVKADAIVFGLEDVTIPTGLILTVKEGVTFKWDEDDNSAGGDDTAENELIVCGKFRANGTSAKPVTLTSSKTTPAEGDWAGVVVTQDAAAKINYATIKYAEDGVRAIYTADSTTVSNSTLLNNQLDDITAAGDNAHAVSITNNTVTVGGGIGISVSASQATVSGNSVTCNSSSVYGIELAADNNQVVSSNTVQSASLGSALWIGSNANKTPTIQDNSLINSKFGIECVNSKANIGASLHVNTITGNTTGVLADGSNAKPKLRYNDISSNSTGVSAMNAADPDMGTTADSGNNKFLSNSTYCINNRNTSGTLTAKGNYFGNPGGCPTPACFLGSVDVSSWLCIAPFMVEWAIGALPNDPQGFRLLGVRPNPSRSGANLHFALESGMADIQVEVFDLAGRLVRRLDPMTAGIGDHELFWDGRDERGTPVQTGVYFFRAAGNGIHPQSAKLLVVR